MQAAGLQAAVVVERGNEARAVLQRGERAVRGVEGASGKLAPQPFWTAEKGCGRQRQTRHCPILGHAWRHRTTG